MLVEMAEKYSVFKKESIPQDEVTEFMLKKGMYCSLNYKSQQMELQEMQMIQQGIFSLTNESQLDSSVAEALHSNQIFMIVRIDQAISLYEIFRKLSTDLKFKILNFLVLRHLQWIDIQYLSAHFTPKYDPSHIEKYFELNNDGVYCMFLLDSKNAVNISDAFGTLRLNEKGEFKQVIRSSLFGSNEVFFIYSNHPFHVQMLSAYAFKQSE